MPTEGNNPTAIFLTAMSPGRRCVEGDNQERRSPGSTHEAVFHRAPRVPVLIINRANLPVEMNRIHGAGIWVAWRIMLAMIAFQIFTVGSPFDTTLSPALRAVVLVAVPGTIESVAAGWLVLDKTNKF